jgi:hypothetical protein
MAQDLIPGNRPMTVADRVREKRAAERKQQVQNAEPITLNAVTSTTTQVRARLNFLPDDTLLSNLVDQALTALSRGVRWARGSIINLVV